MTQQKYIRRIKLGDEVYQVAGHATETEYGLVRFSANRDNIIDEQGKIIIQGIPGIMEGGGYYFPNDMKPTSVGMNTLLVTEADNMQIGKKSLAITTGMVINVRSAAAGSTVYRVTNTYENRIICYMMKNGYACLNEADAKNTVKITSIQIEGSDFVPDSSPNNSSQSKDIVITTAASVNPNSATTSIRLYPLMEGFSNVFVGIAGNHATTTSYGYSVVVGQRVYNASNASAVFGNAQYNTGNSSLLSGRQHINTKQNAALFGQGHDTSSGMNGVAAFGTFSNIEADTVFVIGNGTSHTLRSNLMELKSNGKLYINGTPIN